MRGKIKSISAPLLIAILASSAHYCGNEPATVNPSSAQPKTSAPPGTTVLPDNKNPYGSSQPANPEPRKPVLPTFPTRPSPLLVDGFAPSSHVGPENKSGKDAPLVVVLHGNYDRPEWECETWARIAGFHGWILCPRGIPTPWASPDEDRWMYRGSAAVLREINAAVAALKAAYPGAVRDGDWMLVGFSLGASLAPNIVAAAPGVFDYLYLVEGGATKLDTGRIRALKRAGIRGIGLAQATSKNRKAAQAAMVRLKKLGLFTVYVDMAGAGHNYRDDFTTTGRASLKELFHRTDADDDSSADPR